MRTILFSLGLTLAFVAQATASDDYFFILRDRGNPYWQTLASGIADAAQSHGIAASVLMQEGEVNAEGQVDQCEAALLRHPKIICMTPVNNQVGALMMKKVQKEGIPVADVDATITLQEAAKEGIDLAFTVGSDNFKIGASAADYAARIAGGKSLKVLILEGAPGTISGNKRVAGFTTRLKEIAPHLQVIASVSAMWDRLHAMNIVQDTLQRHPDLGLVYAANDTMALGAAEAIRNAGKTGQVEVIGVDGTADGRKAVLEGRLSATVAQLPYLEGIRAVELSIAKVKGEKIDQQVTIPTLVLTKELLEKNQDPLLSYVR